MTAGSKRNGEQSSSRLPPYRRRHPLPALVLFVILGLIAGVVWINVIHSANDTNANISCNPPDNRSTDAGQVLDHNALDQVKPATPNAVQVRVLNASGQVNQATLVASSLQQYGFSKAADPANDPLYPKDDMTCYGQIRFGANGESAARTLSIVAPCAQLIRDNRPDAKIDLAVGKKFDDVRPTADGRQAISQLASWAASQQPTAGGQMAQPTGTPPVSASLLASARSVQC